MRSSRPVEARCSVGRVVYWLNMSLDGFIETTDKSPEWAAPSQEVFQHFIDEGRRIALFPACLRGPTSSSWPSRSAGANLESGRADFPDSVRGRGAAPRRREKATARDSHTDGGAGPA